MNEYLAAVLLGVIEGLTEFLPISSTGHLLIAQHWLGARSELFTIAIQAGAIVAVSLVYRQRILQLLRGWGDPQSRDYAIKLGSAFVVTAVFGLLARALGAELPETVAPVAIALIGGGIAILLIERRIAHTPSAGQLGWAVVIAVGLAQVAAGVFPGLSRSAAAIFAAMLFGLSNRPRAAEFAFLVGIPTMFAATGYALVETWLSGKAASEAWDLLAIAFIVSAITGFAAVKWLLHFIAGHSFAPFAWYRIALGSGLLLFL